MKAHRLLLKFVLCFAVSVLGIVGIFAADYFISVRHWKSKEGCKEITKIYLPNSVRILDYKVSEFYSIADRPNHMWLLQTDDGFEALNKRVADFTMGGAESTKYFREWWPELEEKYGSKEVGKLIMGIGTGEETLFISSDGKFAILDAFRS